MEILWQHTISQETLRKLCVSTSFLTRELGEIFVFCVVIIFEVISVVRFFIKLQIFENDLAGVIPQDKTKQMQTHYWRLKVIQ